MLLLSGSCVGFADVCYKYITITFRFSLELDYLGIYTDVIVVEDEKSSQRIARPFRGTSKYTSSLRTAKK